MITTHFYLLRDTPASDNESEYQVWLQRSSSSEDIQTLIEILNVPCDLQHSHPTFSMDILVYDTVSPLQVCCKCMSG